MVLMIESAAFSSEIWLVARNSIEPFRFQMDGAECPRKRRHLRLDMNSRRSEIVVRVDPNGTSRNVVEMLRMLLVRTA